EAIDLIVNCQLKRCVDIAVLLVSSHMHVGMVCAAVGKAVNQPGIAVEIKDYGLVDSKQTVEVSVTHTVRMFAIRLQPEQVNDVDKADFKIGKLGAQQCYCSQCFLGRYVSSR